MTNDRNYLRMMQDCELRVYATDNVRTELEFVLLERLERLIGVDDELDEVNARLDKWQAEANELHAQLAAK